MSPESTNRDLLARWQDGDESAAGILVDRYLVRLTALARSRLSRRLARRLDPEDVALSAWRSFFVATGRGRIDVPPDDDLWPILVTLTLRKLSRQAARHQAEQRDVGREVPLDEQNAWMSVVANDPRPEEAAAVVDELEYLLSRLTPEERDVVSRRLQGESPASIAAAVERSVRTVRRALQRFRGIARQRQMATIDAAPKAEVAIRKREPPDVQVNRRANVPSAPASTPAFAFADLLLEQIVGQGGFGKVYRALDRKRNRIVAVKFLRKTLWRDDHAITALLRETEIVSQLSHPSLIRHDGWGRTPAGAVFVVMEWIEGTNLAKVLADGQRSPAQTVGYVVPVAEGLAVAHEAGIVHGDVTPSNVLVGKMGRIVLTDFGFATSLTQDRLLPRGGTPGFLAPEQVSEAFGPVDERTDVYGIGGLMYALLTGVPPFRGGDVPEILAGVLSSRPAISISAVAGGIPSWLATLIGRCLAKEPANRPASMREVLTLLTSHRTP